jgi:hypothetical protein
MDHSSWLIGASFLLYALYVLLPIVPAVVIFRLFPNTSLALSGPLQNLTLNTTGAFGAYIVTVLLGFSLVSRIDDRIQETMGDVTSPTWQVITSIELRDKDGREIKKPESLIRDLKVLFDPELMLPAYPRVYVRVPLEQREKWPVLRFALVGFEGAELDLNRVLSQGGATPDGRKLVVKQPIVLEQLPDQLLAKPYTLGETHIEPATEGGPPIMK